MKLKLDVEGLNELQKSISRHEEYFKKALPQAVKKGADHLRDDAKRRINSRTGQLASGIVSEITWDKKATKAFAGVGFDAGMNEKFVHESKRTGTRSYIPAAVEHGHKGPGSGGVTQLAVDSEGNYKTYSRGRRAGQIKVQKTSRKDKVAKPQKFMQKTYKGAGNRAAVIRFVNDAVSTVINKGGA